MNHPNIVANKSNQLVLTHVPAAERNPFDLAVVAATRVSVAVVSREKSGGAPCGHGKAANKNLRKKQIERKHASSFFFFYLNVAVKKKTMNTQSKASQETPFLLMHTEL